MDRKLSLGLLLHVLVELNTCYEDDVRTMYNISFLLICNKVATALSCKQCVTAKTNDIFCKSLAIERMGVSNKSQCTDNTTFQQTVHYLQVIIFIGQCRLLCDLHMHQNLIGTLIIHFSNRCKTE